MTMPVCARRRSAPNFPAAKGKNESLDAISLVEANGVYKVPVLINGVLPLQFVLDSGATDVSIPEDVFTVLERIGTITDDDYIGTGRYQLADGSVVQSDRFYIRELRFGTRVLKDVSASIGGKTSSLLLGQSFLKRFASVQVDNTRHALVLGSDLSGANARAGSPPPPAGFMPDQPLPFDPTTRRYAVIPPPSSSAMPSDNPKERSIAAPPPPINLSKIKISEVVRPFGWILPEMVQFIISNASDQQISEITIGNVQGSGACSRSLSDYQSFKKFVITLPPGDSLQVEGKFSIGDYFCIISAK